VIEKQGIPRKTLIDFISVSGGNSWGFQNEMETVEKSDFSLKFAMALALKDMKYAKDLFDSSDFNFPIVNDLVGIFNAAASKGYDVKDVRTIYLYFKELLE
jgi:3-hydroxyisobutyrate dehydrogenase-like beta-hydroxyacid dehydrogenase